MFMNRHFVAEVPFLADADQIFVWCLLERMEVVVCVQKEYILVEGEHIEAMHIIKSGKVDTISQNGLIIRTYTQGSFFGESCGNETEKVFATSSYRAKFDMELAVVAQQDLRLLLDAFPEFKETLGVIGSARRKHEKKEMELFEEKMKKMIKQTGMKTRPVTPPPGKTWGGDTIKRKVENRPKLPNPALNHSDSQKLLLEGLEADMLEFEKQEKRKSDFEMSRSGSTHAQVSAQLKEVQEKALASGISTIGPLPGGEKEDDPSSDEEEDEDSLPELSTRGNVRKPRKSADKNVFGAMQKGKGRSTVVGAPSKQRTQTVITPNRELRRLSIGGNSIMGMQQRKSIVHGLSPRISDNSRGLDEESQKTMFKSLEKLIGMTENMSKTISALDSRLDKLEKNGIAFAGE